MKPTNLECIENCKICHSICYKMAITHCLELGGKHAEPAHIQLMMDCAKICEASASLQLSGSRFCADICALCAKICEECANDCERLGDMQDCVTACRNCVQSCLDMAA